MTNVKITPVEAATTEHPARHGACGAVHYNACPALWGGDPEVPDGWPSWAEQRTALTPAEQWYAIRSTPLTPKGPTR